MASEVLTVRMSSDLKKSFNDVCNDLGMSMTTAVIMLAKSMTRNYRIPAELCTCDPFYGEANMKALRESLKQEAEGKLVHKSMAELEAMANE